MPTAQEFPISQGYGPDHLAYDIACPAGTPLLAMADGVVTYARWDERFPLGAKNGRGFYVDLDHGDGWLSRQIHMNSFPLVDVGDAVQAGRMIGRSGNTGLSTGPHVHVMVSKDGIPVDWMSLVHQG